MFTFSRKSVPRRLRLSVSVILSLLPWPAVWIGLYYRHSMIWTFALYHGVVLLVTSIIGFPLWRKDIRAISGRQALALAVLTVAISVAGLVLYSDVGSRLIDTSSVISTVISRGFEPSFFAAFGIYFVVVNATLEELFWRGVVLNELSSLTVVERNVGTLWTAIAFGAWHYLVLRLLLKDFWPFVGTVFIMLCGIFLEWIYVRSKNILLAILWHALVFDMPIVLIFGVMLKKG